MLKRTLFLFILFIIFVGVFGKVRLNKFGRIAHTEEERNIEYFMKDGQYYLSFNGLELLGNSIFITKTKLITLTTIAENVKTQLRVYDINGNILLSQKFKQVINPKLSSNNKYFVFYNNSKIYSICLDKLKIKEISSASLPFNVKNDGTIIYIKEKEVYWGNNSFLLDSNGRQIINSDEEIFIITKSAIYLLDSKLKKIIQVKSEITDAKVVNSKLYYTTRQERESGFHFKLFDLKHRRVFDRVILQKNINKTHDDIGSPLNYGEENFEFNIGNSYAEIQQYGGSPYLHPGVDFMGNDNQEVYAVKDGYVKGIITIGGEAYWRVAIANEDTEDEVDGYLYAHLNESSITVEVGDEVEAGDLIGTLYPWQYSDFTHIHFSRIYDSGNTWYGDWWAADNSLPDVVNHHDTTPPVFEDTFYQQLLGFRRVQETYLNPDNLQGQFDIIAKCHDLANSSWKIDVNKISFQLKKANNPDSVLYQQFSYAFDFPLDTYINGDYDEMVLETIYARDNYCYSEGNHETREFFHIITNSNGDSLITEDDADCIFDSEQYSDGEYWFKVLIEDASGNQTADSMLVTFNNGIAAEEEEEFINSGVKIYPNPYNLNCDNNISLDFSSATTGKFAISIYNLKGQKIPVDWQKKLKKGKHKIRMNKTFSKHNFNSGVYFLRFKTPQKTFSKKFLIIK